MGFSQQEASTIVALTDAAISENWAPFNEIFSRCRSPEPNLGWINPERPPKGLLPKLLNCLNYWKSKRRDGSLPDRRDFDPIEMKGILGNLHVLRESADGIDFEYLIYGTSPGQRIGMKMTHRNVSDLPGLPGIRHFFAAQYRAVLATKQPLYSRHTPPPIQQPTTWDRLIMPIKLESGRRGCLTAIVGRDPLDVTEVPPDFVAPTRS